LTEEARGHSGSGFGEKPRDFSESTAGALARLAQQDRQVSRDILKTIAWDENAYA
jgi:hypothetical protein